uniref:Family with sequence similarity 185 member A n=1 Tax=Sus scrofa TaxID=9823 RepID=A0A8D1ITS9_PIG
MRTVSFSSAFVNLVMKVLPPFSENRKPDSGRQLLLLKQLEPAASPAGVSATAEMKLKLSNWCWLSSAVLAAYGFLVMANNETEEIKDEAAKDACPVRLESRGKCEEVGGCPYQVNLPPLTLQLPKQFGRIEEVFKEVQNLKEIVNSLKKTCQDCRLQADDNRDPGRNGLLSPGTGAPGEADDSRVRELENEVNKLSSDLKNAKEEIDGLQGRLEKLSLVNMNNIENYVDNKVANLTFAVNSLDGKCSSRCPSQEQIQSRPDLNIKSSGSGCVKVQNFECDNCRIETEQGTSILQSVKTVTVNKLQGSSVNISTEDGLLKAKYLYTESSFLSSAAGDISLGSVHGNITLQSKLGNITVDSSSGCLNASTHQGAIDVYVSHLGKVDLKSHKGSILVKVASSLQAYLQLSGKKIDVNSEVHVEEMNEAHKDDGVVITGLLNQASKNEKWIKADAPQGTISFRSQSWFQSLKLLD